MKICMAQINFQKKFQASSSSIDNVRLLFSTHAPFPGDPHERFEHRGYQETLSK